MKLAIIDDEQLIREGLKIIFSAYKDIDVVALGSDGNEAVEICRTIHPDIILLDIRMPHCNGTEAAKQIHSQFPDIKILILTTFTDTEYIMQAIKNGASGYLLKDSAPDVIYEGIKAAYSGSVVINPSAVQNIFYEEKNIPKAKDQDVEALMKKYNLSQKEIDIITLIANGFSNKEIAQKQFLSEGTIKNNISVIFSKTFVEDRTQLASFAFKNRIVH